MGETIRMATERDVAAILEIYAPLVSETAVSFELEPPSAHALAERNAETQRVYPWLVLERQNGVAGYAYASSFRKRQAYDWSSEVSVYVAEPYRGQGVARALYRALLALLRLQGFARAIAGITLPNPASVAFHERFGFVFVGCFARVGFKFSQWHDVGFWQLDLGATGDAPPRLRSPESLRDDPSWVNALRENSAD